MTTWIGGKPTKEEAAIAKNYLTAIESNAIPQGIKEASGYNPAERPDLK
jgi:hypothetical protein